MPGAEKELNRRLLFQRLAVALMAFSVLSARPSVAETINCEIEKITNISGHSDEFHELVKETYVGQKLLFDTATGALITCDQFGSCKRQWTLEVVEEGNAENSLQALTVVKGTGSTVIAVLTIQVWKKGKIPFTFVEQMERAYQGHCTL